MEELKTMKEVVEVMTKDEAPVKRHLVREDSRNQSKRTIVTSEKSGYLLPPLSPPFLGW